MRTRISIPALLAIGALGALAGPALAAPSETHITTPADPAFITFPSSGPTSLAIGGTSNGKTDKVDIRCDGTVALLLKANVTPNAAGSFGTVSIYSFSVPKVLTTGQGGVVLVRKPGIGVSGGVSDREVSILAELPQDVTVSRAAIVVYLDHPILMARRIENITVVGKLKRVPV